MERLRVLEAALEGYDVGGMNVAVEELLANGVPEAMRADIRKVSKSILIAEYEEALRITKSMLKK
jgi:hypothetical protein